MTLHRFPKAFLFTVALGTCSTLAMAQPATKPLPPGSPTTEQMEAQASLLARDAIIRGLAYLGNPELPLDPDALLIHAYLKDRFGLPELCAEKQGLAAIRKEPGGTLYKFLRITDTLSFRPDFLKMQGQGFDNITLAGMWYDKLEKPSVLTDRINASVLEDTYVATHSLWAVAMARQCFGANVDTLLEYRLVEKVKERMDQIDPRWGDEGVEALAMLQYNDSAYVPPYKYIQDLAGVQNPNGSWSVIPGQDVDGSQHTTVLALWALLQYKPLAWPVQPRDMVVR